MRAPFFWRRAAVLALLAVACRAQAAEKERKKAYPLAVLPFTERGPETQGLGSKVTDLLLANLVARPELFLVDREEMEKVLKEQELNLSGVVKPTEATKVGQLTGAKILVTGSVLQVDSTLYIVAKIIGTETTRVVGASVKATAREQIGPLVEKLGEQVAQTIAKRADALVAQPAPREDRVAAVKKALGGAKRPTVLVNVQERHVGQATLDPAAQTELMRYLTETGFKVVDSDGGRKKDADILIVGAGVSEFAARHGNLISVKARLEVKAIDQFTDNVVAIDRQVSVAVDLTEQLSGKAALQEAAAAIAERLLPRLVKQPSTRRSE